MTRRVAMSPIPITIQFSMWKLSLSRVRPKTTRTVFASGAAGETPTGQPPGRRRYKTKGRPRPAFVTISIQELLFGGDRVFRCLGDAEFHDGLRLVLDGF